MSKFAAVLLLATAVVPSNHHSWKLINNKHYQVVSNSTIYAPQDVSGGVCSFNMAHVKGRMKQDPDKNPYAGHDIESLQKKTCIKWINKDFPERCATFDRAQWVSISSGLATKPMDFCIDQYEFPNQKGENPVIFVNFSEAKSFCAAENKRLCAETEWTFACEGEEATPYPYGYVRDNTACNIDKPWKLYDGKALHPRDQAANELDRLWQGEPSGARSRCVSSFGVYDLTGNVDEWTSKDRPDGKYQSILKGGYWSKVRNRCRPSTRSHNENHTFYQQGFRCCSDVK